ncbi:MAG: purine-nucleoside phosphorylase [Clostridiales bacterium]|nr:purine-nucleoside phosphorylase [Clostridiales bacterium]
MNLVDKILKKLNKKYGIEHADIGVVSGSGLSSAIPELDNVIKISYQELGLPKSKVQGHSGNFVFGELNGKRVVIISRMHFYESGDIAKVRLPFDIVAKLGVKQMILMTSCGGLNKSFKVGDVMLIEDQINMSGINPLVGIENLAFINMSNCYDLELRNEVKTIARQEELDLREGVFCQMSGPTYETNAEVEMLRKLGADSVSMSTAHDCIVANYYGMKVVGFSVIVNVFTGEQANLNHQEVLDNAQKACDKVKKILVNLI